MQEAKQAVSSLFDATLRAIELFIALHPQKHLFEITFRHYHPSEAKSTTQDNIYVQINGKKPFLNINLPFDGNGSCSYIFYDKSSSMVNDYGATPEVNSYNIVNRMNWLCRETGLAELEIPIEQ